MQNIKYNIQKNTKYNKENTKLRGSRSERPRCNARAHTRWHSPLLLASAAPRRMPRRAMAADNVTAETYYYGCQLIIGGIRSKITYVARAFSIS